MVNKIYKNTLSLSLLWALFHSVSVLAYAPWLEAKRIVANIQSPNIPSIVFNIKDYGAKNEDVRPALMKAIDAASKLGGGKVVVPAGSWLSKGPIYLKSKINLHLSEGARILVSGEPAGYLPVVKTRWEGTEVYTYSPLVYAANVEDVAITSKGTLDGNVNSQFIQWMSKAKESYLKLRKMGAKATPVKEQPLLDVTFKNIEVKKFNILFNVNNATGIHFQNFVTDEQRIDGSLSWQQSN